MPISEEFVTATGEALAEHCPLASQDAATIETIKSKILNYEQQLGQEPTPADVIRWTLNFESQLRQQADVQAAEIAREADRQYRRELALSPSDEARTAAIEDFRERNQVEPPAPFVPAREYTQAELDSMSSEEYAVKVLGRNNIADRNGVGTPSKDKTADDILKKRVMRGKSKTGAKADQQMRAALRRQIREGLK